MTPITELGPKIPSIPNDRTIERFGQIQKVIFQRRFEEGTDENVMDASLENPESKASWDTLLAAEDGTKVTVSPFISEPESEAGEPRTYGGGNATLNGIEIVLGVEPSPFVGKVLEAKQPVIREMKKLQAETLSVFLVNEHGQIGCLSDGKDPVEEYKGIPIHSLFVGDKRFGNFEEPDSNDVQFVFAPNFSGNFVVITPDDFNPLHDLENPE